jgi:hypothetical protein
MKKEELRFNLGQTEINWRIKTEERPLEKWRKKNWDLTQDSDRDKLKNEGISEDGRKMRKLNERRLRMNCCF